MEKQPHQEQAPPADEGKEKIKDLWVLASKKMADIKSKYSLAESSPKSATQFSSWSVLDL
jgi:hypothetical protein